MLCLLSARSAFSAVILKIWQSSAGCPGVFPSFLRADRVVVPIVAPFAFPVLKSDARLPPRTRRLVADKLSRTGHPLFLTAGASPDHRSPFPHPKGGVMAPPRPLRVLMVEDYPDAATSTVEILRLSGHEVRLAVDGPAALEAALADEPDVVLLDLGLPKM